MKTLAASCLIVLLLAGCGKSAVERAQEDVDFLTTHGATAAEVCDAYGKLADAQREARNAKAWEDAKLFRDIHCRTASQGR